jgi:hypothetical protein
MLRGISPHPLADALVKDNCAPRGSVVGSRQDMSGSAFSRFSKYAQGLRQLAAAGGGGDAPRWSSRCEAALNGQPSQELRSVVPLNIRRTHGTFFTGSTLANRLVRHVDLDDSRDLTILDPTCGVGDLLLAVAHRLPLKRSLEATLHSWGQVLRGVEREGALISAAKARLVLLALRRLGLSGPQNPDWSNVFPFICQGDAMRQTKLYARTTRILLNPPFGRIPAPQACKWGAGKVNAAAIFLHHTLQNADSGTRVFAILPEVLRTGTRYGKWRELVSREADVTRVEPYGIFDDSADVHVFLLVLSKRSHAVVSSRGLLTCNLPRRKQTLEVFFDVSVGAVVPYRDPHVGPVRRFVHPRNVPAWSRVLRVNETRRFQGTVAKPPFVVIRRTSRPGDAYRATAAILLGASAVAIENHLFVCRPRDGRQTTCERLMAELKSDGVNRFLDDHMRCRHLTVGIVKQIPLTLPKMG